MISTRYKLIKIGLCGYILIILYNGIIKHIGLQISILETIRPFLPEFFLVIYLIGWLLSKKSYRKKPVYLSMWLIVVSLTSLFNVPSLVTILSTYRDLLEPCLFLITLSTINLNDCEKTKLIKMIEKIFMVFVLIGIYFAIIQRINGSQWTAIYFAGRPIWGVDSESGLRISSGSFGFKVLGTTASAETFGFYNMLALIIIIFLNKNLFLKFIFIAVSFINIYLSGMKTALLVAILALYIFIMNKRSKIARIMVKVGSVIILFGIFYYMVFVLSEWEDSSFYARLVLWKSLLSKENLINLIFPMNMYFYSAKSGNTGIISFWDNSYFYFMFSTGVFGMLLFVSNIWEKSRVLRKLNKGMINCGNMIILSLALSSISTCLFLGRNYIAIAIIIVCIQSSCMQINDEVDLNRSSVKL
ncbi:MAG: O-antigen ligase family protein [Lachnospiraceae bacterium]|nr:O-antigen ligase family protein [Lachnospiraceae bacterium]